MKYNWRIPVVGVTIAVLFWLFIKSLSWLDSLYEYAGVADSDTRTFAILATYGLIILIISGFKRETDNH